MGVGAGFWEVLKPVCHRSEDLSSLRGKKLAIDLSFWIVQQEAVLKDKARKPHLRLLFFRVVTLIAKVGAYPVFVVDGEAPLLKLNTRMERFSRFSGVPVAQLQGSGNQRNQMFLDSVEECVELLKLLGVPVLRAKGEAEALCAELERECIVDGCVTPDSDAFLHGAGYVIQTLQADSKNPLMEAYFSADVASHLQLGREHLIALALLVGCDYDTHGVPGIGYAKAVRLVQSFPENEILNQLRRWGRGEFPSTEEIKRMSGAETELEGQNDSGRKDSHCSSCGHPGNKKVHTKLGCQDCGALSSEAGCIQKTKGFKCACKCCIQTQKRKKQEKDISWWSKLSSQISSSPGFPNEQIIELFLNSANNSYLADGQSFAEVEWKAPDMQLLEPFLANNLHWDADYIRKKTFPLQSYFCLKAMAGEPSSSPLIDNRFSPASIERVKVEQGKQFFLLKWKPVSVSSVNDWLTTPVAEVDGDVTSVEDISLVRAACPELVSKFEEKQSSKKKPSRRVKKMQPDSNQKSIKSFFKSKETLLLSPTFGSESTEAPGRKSVIIEADSDDSEHRPSVKRRLF